MIKLILLEYKMNMYYKEDLDILDIKIDKHKKTNIIVHGEYYSNSIQNICSIQLNYH